MERNKRVSLNKTFAAILVMILLGILIANQAMAQTVEFNEIRIDEVEGN